VSNDRKRALRERASNTNKTVAIYAGGAFFVGVALLYASAQDTWAWNETWRSVANSVGGLFIATALLSAGWELFGKRSFTNEIMARANLGSDIEKSGIAGVTDAYLDDVPWDELMTGATKVDIVVAYANTWRNARMALLTKLAQTPGVRLRVFLPDPDDDLTMNVLANRFGKTVDDVRGKVNEAILEFGEFRTAGGADLEIYVRAGDVVFSCYRFDGRAVLTLYSHGRVRQPKVPTLVLKSGALWQFVHEEIAAIKSQSRPLS
jgi:hypothetical protein